MLNAFAFSLATTHAETIFAIDTSNRLLSFDSAAPSTVTFINNGAPISGLQVGDELLGIDFRPVAIDSPAAAFDSVLYGVSVSNNFAPLYRLYTINTATGEATPVGLGGQFKLNGGALGVDFDPVADRLRIVSAVAENLRVDPNDGSLTATDTPLAYVAGDSGFGLEPTVVGAAYTNNFGGAAVATLYGIDSGRNVLVRQGGPNGTPSPDGGELTTIGSGLGVKTTNEVGFDISGSTGVAYASLSTVIGPLDPSSGLYTVDLATGDSTRVGTIGPSGGPGAFVTRDIAAPVGLSVPEPGVASLLAIGLAALAGRWARRPSPPSLSRGVRADPNRADSFVGFSQDD